MEGLSPDSCFRIWNISSGPRRWLSKTSFSTKDSKNSGYLRTLSHKPSTWLRFCLSSSQRSNSLGWNQRKSSIWRTTNFCWRSQGVKDCWIGYNKPNDRWIPNILYDYLSTTFIGLICFWAYSNLQLSDLLLAAFFIFPIFLPYRIGSSQKSLIVSYYFFSKLVQSVSRLGQWSSWYYFDLYTIYFLS